MLAEIMKNTALIVNRVLPSALNPESELVSAIKRDHDDLKALIEVLKSEDKALATKRSAYRRFSELLKSHSKAEETAVYETCRKFRALKTDTFEGIIEHEVAESLMQKIQNTKKPEKWAAAVQVLAELVEHHIGEEEAEYLPKLDRTLTPELKLQAEALFLELRQKTQAPGMDTGVLTNLKQ